MLSIKIDLINMLANSCIVNQIKILLDLYLDAKWVEEFDERKDPMGRTYYWLTRKGFSFAIVGFMRGLSQ